MRRIPRVTHSDSKWPWHLLVLKTCTLSTVEKGYEFVWVKSQINLSAHNVCQVMPASANACVCKCASAFVGVRIESIGQKLVL